MEPLTAAQIRAAMVNCSRGQATAMNLPRLDEIAWSERDFLGWRDPKAPLRGYLIVPYQEGLVGLLLRAAESTMSSRISAVCLLCRTGRGGGDIKLFAAPRRGAAGRNGNTVGTYICADLACSDNVRQTVSTPRFQLDPGQSTESRIEGLKHRVDAFVANVQSA